MIIQRTLFPKIIKAAIPGKIVLLLGARRTGKTFLLNQLLEKIGKEKCLLLNGEDILVQQALQQRTVNNYQSIASGFKFIFIDEAQKIPNAGLILKLIIDEVKGVRLIVTGSSMFDLNNKLGEPLTGRKSDFILFPISQYEFTQYENKLDIQRNLENKIIYGCYPELLNYKTNLQRQKYLHDIVSSYLYKDILILENLRNADKIFDLLKLIAWQIGKEVSLEELGRNLQMSKNTVERYLDLLTKVFVLFKIRGFSRNLRNEIVKTKRWYFFDNGIRNAVISNFQNLKMRNDIGMLWENFLASERLKFQHYFDKNANNYFWRTHDRQEIDWVEERNGKLSGFEFKYSLDNKSLYPPQAWKLNYPSASYKVIHKNNFEEFVLPGKFR